MLLISYVSWSFNNPPPPQSRLLINLEKSFLLFSDSIDEWIRLLNPRQAVVLDQLENTENLYILEIFMILENLEILDLLDLHSSLVIQVHSLGVLGDTWTGANKL